MLSDLDRPNHDGSPIRGDFRLKHYWERSVEGGGSQGVLTLEDASGRYGQIIADEDPSPIRGITCPTLVRAVIQPVAGVELTKAIVLSLEEIGVDDIENGAALLPRAECAKPALPALNKLIDFNANIRNPVLKSFLNRVLLDDLIANTLMTESAGMASAHPYRGGLLSHATEWFGEAERMASQMFPNYRYDPTEETTVSLMLLTYLFHDLHPALMRDLKVDLSDYYYGVMTAKLLEPHLDWLEQQDGQLANDFRRLLMPDRRQEPLPKPLLLASNIIRWCDNQRRVRDQALSWARLIGDPAANESAGSLSFSPWMVRHV